MRINDETSMNYIINLFQLGNREFHYQPLFIYQMEL